MKQIISLALFAITFALTGCIGSPQLPPTEQVAVDSATPAATSEESAATESGRATGECEEGFRLYDHALLATDPLCIPENPQRIAFIDDNIGYAVALGVESITRSYYYDVFLGDFPGLYDEAAYNQMRDVGNTWEMNGESLAVAKPDLVITSAWWTETNELIKEIAPTIIYDLDNIELWQAFHTIAELTDTQGVADDLLAGIEERQAVLRDLLRNKTEGMSFTVSIIESGDSIWMFNASNFGANIAFDAGLAFTENVPTPEETPDQGAAIQISLEQLPLIDADHVFLFTNWNSGAEKELFANPVWQSFAASNPDRIHFLTGEHWVREHPYAAHRVIDDLFRYVAKVDPAEVSPNPFAYTYPAPEGAASE